MLNYLKSFGIFIALFITMSLLVAILYYFDILSNGFYNIIKFIIPIISIFISTLYLGKNSKEKGWLQGIKYGLVLILLLFMLSFLGFNNSLTLKGTIYYLILLSISMFGSMIGIGNNKEN